jgi:hypothetical protein
LPGAVGLPPLGVALLLAQCSFSACRCCCPPFPCACHAARMPKNWLGRAEACRQASHVHISRARTRQQQTVEQPVCARRRLAGSPPAPAWLGSLAPPLAPSSCCRRRRQPSPRSIRLSPRKIRQLPSPKRRLAQSPMRKRLGRTRRPPHPGRPPPTQPLTRAATPALTDPSPDLRTRKRGRHTDRRLWQQRGGGGLSAAASQWQRHRNTRRASGLALSYSWDGGCTQHRIIRRGRPGKNSHLHSRPKRLPRPPPGWRHA